MANDRNRYRPSFKRQMLYAGAMLAAILIAYFLTTLFFASTDPKPEPKPEQNGEISGQRDQTVKPWYQKQNPPPSMITAPDLPLFPEIEDQGSEPKQAERAYEEALPKETYVPPESPAAPEPVVAPMAEQPRPPPPQVALLPGQLKSPASTASLPRWRRFAVATPLPGDMGKAPLIAIVIDDMGVDKKRSAMAIDLNAPLTLSFLTYATELGTQTARARAKGHELMLHVSMEPGSMTVDPGPNVLLTGLSDEELRRRLEWGFQRFSTYVGVNNHMGSKFTSDRKAMGVVIDEIKRRGLLFLDSRTSSKTVGAKLARERGVPVAERNIFLDHENTVEAVNEQLRKVEKMARRTGKVIAIGHPRDATIRALRPWLSSVEDKGFKLVTLTTIMLRNNAP